MPTRKKYSKEFKIDAVRKMSIILRHKPFEFSVATLHECRLVNPYRFGQFGCRRRFFHKALRMLLIGGIQHFLSLFLLLFLPARSEPLQVDKGQSRNDSASCCTIRKKFCKIPWNLLCSQSASEIPDSISAS